MKEGEAQASGEGEAEAEAQVGLRSSRLVEVHYLPLIRHRTLPSDVFIKTTSPLWVSGPPRLWVGRPTFVESLCDRFRSRGGVGRPCPSRCWSV